jgi:hypothetical protein
MLNPLNRKNVNKSLLQSQDGSKIYDRKESENEIYCVLCKIKYTIEDYKQHISQHKRICKSSISEFYNGKRSDEVPSKIKAK